MTPMNKISTLIYFVNKFQASAAHFEKGVLNAISNGMEESDVGPSEQTIENILNFARSYEVVETEETGYIEMNLN